MVLFNANSLVALIISVTSLGVTSAHAQEDTSQVLAQKSPRAVGTVKRSAKPQAPQAPWYRQMRVGQRGGVGLITIPQAAYLRSSLGYDAEILTVSSGVSASYDVETRIKRFIFYGSAGVSVLGVKASSMDDSITYSYGESNYINYMLGMGAYYITENFVRFGMGLRSLYGSYTLPVPETPGVTYVFNYGSPFKNYMSFDFNWQLAAGWIFGQTLLHPLSNDLSTGWQLTLKRSF